MVFRRLAAIIFCNYGLPTSLHYTDLLHRFVTQLSHKPLGINGCFDTMQHGKYFYPYDFKLGIYLRDRKSIDKPTDVIFAFRWLNNRLNFTRGIKVVPRYWDSVRQRAIVSYTFPTIINQAGEYVNRVIDADIAIFHELVEYVCCNPGEITKFAEALKKNFMRKGKSRQTSTSINVFDVIRKAVLNDRLISDDTQNNYINKGLKALKAFSAYRKSEGRGEILSFEEFDNDLIAEFIEFLGSGLYTSNNGKAYAMGTLNSIIKYAVAAIKCVDAKYLPKSKSVVLKAPQLTNKTADNNEIALTNEEVTKLRNYTAPCKADQETLDMFLLECTTGQRVSDLPKVGEGVREREGIMYITIVQEKTSKKIEVPIIFEIAKELLCKYKSGLPNVTKDKINKNIKRIAREAGIKGEEMVSRHYNGADKPTVTHHDRCDLISSHTGRRTFVSLLSIRGWNYEEIAKYTGHTNIKTVATYDKSTAMDREAYKNISETNRVRLLNDEGIERSSDIAKEARDAVDVLIRGAEMLGISLAPKGKVDLPYLSSVLQKEKERVIATYGENEYQKLRKGLQFGRTPEEKDLLNDYFCVAMPNTFHGRPIQVIGFNKAQAFWEKVASEELTKQEYEYH